MFPGQAVAQANLSAGQLAEFPTLGFVPCPGNADAAASLASEVRNVTTQLGDALAEMNGSAFQRRWEGKAADAFRDTWTQLRPKVDTLHQSMNGAADALGEWAGYMPGQQSAAHTLEERARQIEQALDALPAPPPQLIGAPSIVRSQELSELYGEEQAATYLRNEERREQLNDQLDNIQEQARLLAQAYASHGEDIADRLRSALSEVTEGGFFSRIGRALADGVLGPLEPLQEWIVGNAARIGEVGDVLALYSTVMAVGSELPFMPPTAKAVLGIGAAVLGLGALSVHGTAKLAGAEVTGRTLKQDFLGALGFGTVGGLAGGYAKTIGWLGRFGTGDSIHNTYEDPSTLRYFVPTNARQGLTLLTGQHALVAFENAWRAGGEMKK
ncbi:WXG100 family type VII secretion target [Streptomyces johnsoniae]|uniref:WXG100 family type VII secretion target n=1 Tax=Streptomyces johnsoniae TaxID=3075532 RepID=A0ABU2S875_9ACTN|nr:WXG100 family type VII secretion target [Streptomyces sp. DSM 41886]MDT0444044.1 WXG100 family type VII secretion target [Streptomyces sp. DSM 41886]